MRELLPFELQTLQNRHACDLIREEILSIEQVMGLNNDVWDALQNEETYSQLLNHELTISQLLDRINIDQLNDRQNTHNDSIHQSASQSALKLKEVTRQTINKLKKEGFGCLFPNHYSWNEFIEAGQYVPVDHAVLDQLAQQVTGTLEQLKQKGKTPIQFLRSGFFKQQESLFYKNHKKPNNSGLLEEDDEKKEDEEIKPKP